jgi:hypothetical protein
MKSKIGFKDRSRKPIYRFHSKYFSHYNGKKCLRCGKRKENFHHKICNKCHAERNMIEFKKPNPLNKT